MIGGRAILRECWRIGVCVGGRGDLASIAQMLSHLSMSRSDRDEWPFLDPPEYPPPSITAALATPLRRLAGCWILSRCRWCESLKDYPVRMLLTERWERADMPLQRAVSSLMRCELCGRMGCELSLVSDPKWRTHRAAGKPLNWSMVLSGSARGTVAFTEA